MISLTDFLEIMTFLLVIKLMLPVTQSDIKKRSKFQRFLFSGFVDKNELRAAVLANNRDMDEQQRFLID